MCDGRFISGPWSMARLLERESGRGCHPPLRRTTENGFLLHALAQQAAYSDGTASTC